MAELFFADLVREMSFATGTGPFALAGAAPGHRSFADAVPAGAAFHYAIAGVTRTDQWETGEGAIAADGTLLRSPIESSAGGGPVDFDAGLKSVVLTVGSAWFAGQQEALAGKADLAGAAFAGPVWAPELALGEALAIGDGGTGAGDAAGARENLGLGSAALESSAAFVAAGEKGTAGGVATLDGAGRVPAAQLPPSAGVSSVNGQSGAVTLAAADIASAAAGDIAATSVQQAIAELAGEKAALSGAAFAGAISAPELTLAAPLAIAQGGTGAAGAAAARANLGLGSAALQASAAFVAATEKGAAGGVATLDSGGKVPAAQLPTGGGVSSVNGQSGAVTLTAANIGSSATGDVAATNVQAAIAELASEKAALAGAAFVGTVSVTGQAAFGSASVSGAYKLTVNADGAAIAVSAASSTFATPAMVLSRGSTTAAVTPTSGGFEIGTQSAHDVIVKRGSSERLRIQSAGIAVTGSADVSTELRQGGTKVVGARVGGWSAASGTATRTTFDTGSATTGQLAERLKALIDDLIAHGLIGA